MKIRRGSALPDSTFIRRPITLEGTVMADRRLSPIVAVLLAAMTASWRIRRVVLVLAIVLVISGASGGVLLIGKGTPEAFLMAYATVLIGCGLLFWWGCSRCPGMDWQDRRGRR